MNTGAIGIAVGVVMAVLQQSVFSAKKTEAGTYLSYWFSSTVFCLIDQGLEYTGGGSYKI